MAKTRAGPVRAGTAADLVLGSWRRTLIVAAALLAVFVAVVVGALNFTNLQHTSFPGHPYPPAGDQPRPGTWLELRANDPAALMRTVLDAGHPRVNHPGHPYYFMAPGGQVFTIVPAV